MTDGHLRYVKVTGDISVEPVTSVPQGAIIYLLMGPTGAGKSSFIEALAGESQKLSISSNQLAGYTQTVTAYQLINVRWADTSSVYLVDTPGFCDSKISEIEVMDMVQDWLKEKRRVAIQNVVYFTSITDTRLAGSRQRTLGMLRQLLISAPELDSVVLATTMWDTLTNERARNRAESNFEQLNTNICNNSFIYRPPTRFMNTRTSALQILDVDVRLIISFSQPADSAAKHLYRDLHERIEGALQRKVMIESDLTHSDALTNKELKDILERDQKENNETLAKFITQLVNFGETPNEFWEAAQTLRETIVANIVPVDHQMRGIFQRWAKALENCWGLSMVSEPELRQTILAMLVEEPVSRKRTQFIPSERVFSEKPAENSPSTQPNFDQCQESQPVSTETVPATRPESGLPTDPLDHRSSRKLDLTEPLRQILKSSKIHRPKWLKREE